MGPASGTRSASRNERDQTARSAYPTGESLPETAGYPASVVLRRPCPYLPGRTWSNRVRLVPDLGAGEYRARLEKRYRRGGFFLFRPECPECQLRLPVRVDVTRFRPSRNLRRIPRRNRDLTVEIIRPAFSPERLQLYRRYLLSQHGRLEDDSAGSLESFVATSIRTLEMSYLLAGRLVGVGIVDDLGDLLSPVYFFFEPEEGRRSLGTFSTLKETDLARERGYSWVYLGYWIPGCSSMEYKGRFRPAQILTRGRWVPLPRNPGDRQGSTNLEGRHP